MTTKKARPGSALGEAIGGFIEEQCLAIAEKVLDGSEFEIWYEGHLPSGYRFKKVYITDMHGRNWQVDGLILVKVGSDYYPTSVIDPKYVQRTKWGYDKGGWLCTAHPSIRRTYPTIRGTIAVLAGRWSDDATQNIADHAIEVVRLPYEHIQEILGESGVDVSYGDAESTSAAQLAYSKFEALEEQTKASIAKQLVEPIRTVLEERVKALSTDAEGERQIHEVNLEIITNKRETLYTGFSSLDSMNEWLQSLDLPNFEKYARPYIIPAKLRTVKKNQST